MASIPIPQHSEASYFCSSCQFHLHEEKEYKNHYKSEFHRYNIKRKLLEFVPVTYEQFMKRKNSILMKLFGFIFSLLIK